jgi:hypothetical protein
VGDTLQEIIEDWRNGVITSLEPDEIPANASPRGRNSALSSIGGEKAVVQKRRGMRTINRTAVTGSPTIHGQYAYKRLTGGTFTTYHMVVSDNGRLDTLASDGTLTTISATAFTSGDLIPDFATASNLAFIVNGTDAKKFNGTAVQNFGITKPSTAPTIADAGDAGSHNGTYEARVTFYNDNTGHESSAGPTSSAVSITNSSINWTSVPVSSDTQVTARRLYLRNTSTQSNFFLAGTIANNTATTASTNVTDASLITLGPDEFENDPPPSGVKYLAWHNSRLFAADDTNVYYSGVGTPEAFDPDNFERVNTDDGQKITALHSAQDVLIVFKGDAMYGIFGDTPGSWQIRSIDTTVGCTSHRSVRTVEGLTYWWSEQGPMRWDGVNAAESISAQFINETVGSNFLNPDRFDHVVAELDMPNQRLMFLVPEAGQTRLTAILPFNYRLQRWESDRWDPMDLASMTVVEDTNGQPWVHVGNYGGQVFKWWDADNDGVANDLDEDGHTVGTLRGTFVAAAGSVTTITDATATFDTTGAGLKERKVTVVNSSGLQVGSLRPRITSNTATSITLATAVTGLTIGQTYTYIVGGPDFAWDTYWSDLGEPFTKKRFEFFYCQAKAQTATVDLTVELTFNYNDRFSDAKSVTFTAVGTTGTWDESLWDESHFQADSSVNQRIRVGRTGWIYRARFINRHANEPVTILKAGMRAERLTDALN